MSEEWEGVPPAVVEYWRSHPGTIWLYDGNFALAIAAAVLYTIPALYLFQLTVFKYKSYYFTVVSIGAGIEAAGYTNRAISIKNYDVIGPYATSSTFIVVAPLFIGAGSYLLITRLCLRVLPPTSKPRKILLLPIRRLTLIFVLCDIFTLLVQASGSAIAASNNWEGEMVKIGENVLIGGLALQLATFSFFLVIVWQFHVLTQKEGLNPQAGEGWKKVLWAVSISCSMIVIRCIYRLIEFALGIFGYPFTHEWIFYVFEAIPMIPAIGVFCIWHPGAYFGAGKLRGGKEVLSTGGVVVDGSDGSGSKV